MPLPGDPEVALIDEACWDLQLPAFRERFVERATAARREQATYKQLLLDLLSPTRTCSASSGSSAPPARPDR